MPILIFEFCRFIAGQSKHFENLQFGSKIPIYQGQILLLEIEATYQWRREGGGTPELPPPETGKIVVEIWCYLPEVNTFERSQKSKKYLVKNCEKSQFSIEILIKKSQNFLEDFHNSLHFWSKTRNVLQAGCLVLPVQSKSFIRSQLSCFFL